MNKWQSYFRQYKNDSIAFVVNVSLIAITLPLFIENPVIAFIISSCILIIFFFLIIYFRTRDKDFYFQSLDKPGYEKDWIGTGKFSYISNEKCFEITNSDSGYIFRKTFLWDDYIYTSEFKISVDSLGFILRSNNLSNCIMFQFFEDRIRPHIRINAQWITLEEITLSETLSKDRWYISKIYCEKRSIRILIKKDKETIFDRHWLIPEFIDVVFKEVDRHGQPKGEFKTKQKIDFDFGSIGIRNSGPERAFIKNVVVERL